MLAGFSVIFEWHNCKYNTVISDSMRNPLLFVSNITMLYPQPNMQKYNNVISITGSLLFRFLSHENKGIVKKHQYGLTNKIILEKDL